MVVLTRRTKIPILGSIFAALILETPTCAAPVVDADRAATGRQATERHNVVARLLLKNLNLVTIIWIYGK